VCDILNLDRVVFIGRTFSEYMRMLNPDPSQLKSIKILDCPSGASSFVGSFKRTPGEDRCGMRFTVWKQQPGVFRKARERRPWILLFLY
jgi:hypothetical protein